MNFNEEKVHATIAEQAVEWFVANDEEPLVARDSATLTAWLKASPVHVREFLGVSAIARDLKQALIDPAYSLQAILACARAEDAPTVQSPWARVTAAVRGAPSRYRLTSAVTIAVFVALSLSLLFVVAG